MKRSHSYNSNMDYSYDQPLNKIIVGACRAGKFHVKVYYHS